MTVEPLIGHVDAPDLHVMTFNIRRDVHLPTTRSVSSHDRWRNRRPRLQALLATARPTLLGVQEALPAQAAAVAEALGDRYCSIGHGRGAGGRGEACPLFFDATRLDLLDWDQTALSDRPDITGSRSWGNLIPRVLVAAVFRDRATSARFLAMNTHLDHVSARSRRLSAERIRQRVQDQPLPAVVAGDLNARAGSPELAALLAGGHLVDAWQAATERMTPEWTTFAEYRPPRDDGGRIDWIAVSPDVEVTRAAIDARLVDGGWASDHLPLHAVVRIPAAETSA